MRNWKRILGLSKLSAMAALLLGSCSEWATDEMLNQTYPHTGIVYPSGMGWGFAPHADKRGSDNLTLKDYVIDICIVDACQDAPGQIYPDPAAIKRDSNFYDKREYHIFLDTRTTDSVWIKQFMPEYHPDLSLYQWSTLVDEAHKVYLLRVDFNRKWAYHEHECDHRIYRVQPADIIRVTRDSIAR